MTDSGKKQLFYDGIPAFFEKTKQMFKNDSSYSEFGIQVEHYNVSTGFAETIRGTCLAQYVDGIWGCELLDEMTEDGLVISEVYIRLLPGILRMTEQN